MPVLVAMLTSALLAADLDLSAQVTGRRGSAAFENAPDITTGQLNGGASLALGPGPLHLTAGYSAQGLFTLTQTAGNVGADVLQIGRLLGEYRFSREQIVRLEEAFSYGQQYFSALGVPLPGTFATSVPGGPLTVLDPHLSVFERLAYVSSRTSAGFDQEISSQLRFGFGGGYTVSGGADRTAQTALPLQHGIDANAKLNWILPPFDKLSLGVNGYATRFTNGQENSIITADFDWQRAFSRYTRTDLSVGGGVARTRCWSSTECPATAATSNTSGWSPAMEASAAITRDIPLQRQFLSGSLRGSVSTTVDPRGGGVYQLAEGRASATWLPIRELRLGAETGVARALNGPLERRAVVAWAELSAALSPVRVFEITCAARTAWQQNPVVDVATQRVLSKPWAGYASLDLGASYALAHDVAFSLGARALWQQATLYAGPVQPIDSPQVAGMQWSAFASVGFAHHEKF